MQLPFTVDNFRQHLLHLSTSIITFRINELKLEQQRRHLAWRHWALPCRETNVAAVGPYHSEPERVPEENKASDDDSDASERPGSLNWLIVFLVNSEELKESTSVFSNGPSRKKGLRLKNMILITWVSEKVDLELKPQNGTAKF